MRMRAARTVALVSLGLVGVYALAGTLLLPPLARHVLVDRASEALGRPVVLDRMALFHPNASSNPCPTGASTIVPSDPTAATSPTVWLRFSGAVARETVPINTPNPVPAMPMPIKTPASVMPPGSDFEYTMSSNPAA